MATLGYTERFFILELHDLINVKETLLAQAPAIAEQIHDEGLKASLAWHFAETNDHLCLLKFIRKRLDLKPLVNPDNEIDFVLKACRQTISLESIGHYQRDQALIRWFESVEKYEILKLQSASEHCEKLGYNFIFLKLNQILAEELQAENKLCFIRKRLRSFQHLDYRQSI